LKYHILLTCALYYNFKAGFDLNNLYFCENTPPESLFQIIYYDSAHEWALLPQREDALAKFSPKFYKTWERRQKQIYGGDYQILDALFASIGSWTVALAFLEDFQVLANLS
jgi:hypothetical protein